MHSLISRRSFVAFTGSAVGAGVLHAGGKVQSLETPYKYSRLVLSPSGKDGEYDSKSVDCPFVFHHAGSWWMTFVAFDGIGYQTGLAKSQDLVNWEKVGCILKRDPDSPIRKYNVAMNWILRENAMSSRGELLLIGGKYIGVYHAYPNSGYEQGAAVIGLAYSRNLLRWEPGDPILHPNDGADWERGGLYKPCLVLDRNLYYLFYNAKDQAPSRWREQSGVAISSDLKTWKRYDGNPIIASGGPGSADEIFASDPCVLRSGNEWAFFYYGLDANGVARDLVATGRDLLHPIKHPKPLIDVGPAGSFDSKYAHKPSIVSSGSNLYHFYCAVDGASGVRGIAVARSRPW